MFEQTHQHFAATTEKVYRDGFSVEIDKIVNAIWFARDACSAGCFQPRFTTIGDSLLVLLQQMPCR